MLNVGAGAGSYEPRDRRVVAVEPSDVMIAQRGADCAPAVRALASRLPFRDASFDATLAILTIHHWENLAQGLRELRRTARRRVVLLTADVEDMHFWLFDYFPEMIELDRACMPTLTELRRHLGACTVVDVMVPHDCMDGFLAAYWRRPHAYLDPDVRAAISMFAKIAEPEAGLEALRRDLESGDWLRRYGDLVARTELDLGYRIVIAQL